VKGSELAERGLRNPRHTFGVMHSSHTLMPLFIAPLRPMETMIGIRMRARSMLNRMVALPTSAPMEVEYAVWRVPVRAAGEFFVDMFINDPGDIGQIEVGTMGLPEYAPLPINQQGHRSRTALQSRDRPWAGELAQADGEVSIAPQATYAPYVSQAIWHIARSWYNIEATETTLGDSSEIGKLPLPSTTDGFDYYQNPPKLGRLVRSALSQAIGVGSHTDQSPTGTSLTDWAMRLSVLDNPNRSWPEYLKAQGVDPRRIDGMPEPVIMQRRLLQPYGSPIAAFAGGPTAVAYANGVGTNKRDGWLAGSDPGIQNAGTAAGGLYGNFAGYQMMAAFLDETRGKRLLIEEPTLLIGTLNYRPFDFDQRSQCHVFDAVYMINGGTWGDSAGGAVDERDFLVSRAIDRSVELTTGGIAGSNVPAQNDFGQTSPFAINFLNLYLYGDSYCNAPKELGHHNPPLSRHIPGSSDAYGTIAAAFHEQENLRLNTYGDVRFGVATDLVS